MSARLKKKEYHFLFRYIVTSFFILALFIPSIKFLVFSGVVNFGVMAILIFFACLALAKDWKVSNKHYKLNLFYSLFFLLIIFSGLLPTANIDAKVISKFIFILLLLLSVIILFRYVKLNFFIQLSIFTSTFLVLLNKLNIIEASGSGELSYLILSMQVSLGVAALIAHSLFSPKYKYIYFILLVFNLYGVLSLAGRTSIFSSFLLLSISFFLFTIINFKKKIGTILLIYLIIFSLSGYVFNYLIENVFDSYFLYKMEMLFTGEGDTRFSTYFEAIRMISDSPLGIGLNGYMDKLGYYPHNIFLEIGLNIGVIGIIWFLMLFLFYVFSYFKQIFKHKLVDANKLSLFLMTMSLFISWNASNSLDSSYPLFMCLLLSTLYSIEPECE